MSVMINGAIAEVLPSAVSGVSPVWQDWLDATDLRQLTEHPLMTALSNGNIDLPGLRQLLVQHHLYSRHFTRYLSALISRLPNLEDMRSLTENLLEEMGVDGDDKITHAELLQRTLRVIGADPQAHSPLPQTQALVQTMIRYCCSNDPLEGLAALCLGAEAIVPLIYRPIQDALIGCGFGESATEFFRLHIAEDEAHALTMLAILRRLTQHSPLAYAQAKAIGIDMIGKRCEMFDAIWAQIRKPPEATATQAVLTAFASASSADFWRVPSQLQAQIPERLHHAAVLSGQDKGSEHFSGLRKHKVHIVDLPTNTISMTIGRLGPSESTRLHRHNYETVIYVVAGKGFSRIGPRIVDWTAGDAIYVPVWAAHQHISTDKGECVYIACENAPLLQNLGGVALREELDSVSI